MSMSILIVLVFIIGYLAIAGEHAIRINKAATALITGGICWTIVVLGSSTFFPENGQEVIEHALSHHLTEIASILFFLIGAMTIVEVIDAHEGFSIITDKINTKSYIKLLWIIGLITFFFSALLDNLTTAIVMCALLRKLIKDNHILMLFGGIVIIAANAGGAWSPIGDVTTIMLWIGQQISAYNVVIKLFIPSLICVLLPLAFSTLVLKRLNKTIEKDGFGKDEVSHFTNFERKLILALGVCGLLFVPVFKTVTHLPPYLGMMISLSVVWIISELLHRKKDYEKIKNATITNVISRIDVPTVLFFLGILLAVGALQTIGHLGLLATWLDNTFGNIYLINLIIGGLSAIVDNVPLVAAAMGMYSLETYPQDHLFWESLAFCAGTGGSMLIIGSAAGVAVMGILKIDFMWYLKNVSWLALIGYLAGMAAFVLQNKLF